MSRSLKSHLQAAGVGGLAGSLGSVVQVGVGYVLSQVLLPDGKDNNIAPRLVHRAFALAGRDTNEKRDWELGMLFHLGYGFGWGVVFGLLQRLTNLPAFALALPLGSLIYALAFSRIGVGTQTGTEQYPDGRRWGKRVSLVAVAMAYALATAWFWTRIKPHFQANGHARPVSDTRATEQPRLDVELDA